MTFIEKAELFYLRNKHRRPKSVLCDILRNWYKSKNGYFHHSILSWWEGFAQ